ncbi:OmpA family protein [Halovulum dunhuangense]|uniref:OmpA family protein n=1 Tax=Halovulum dunhuangense TaxID=1505036 RepID=A0A849KZF6_9RHOB|nr:OmpA family protein [Halovulum dunhuangense]NNU79562.1 OmpA family protein [Halovulum dunhuangense]
MLSAKSITLIAASGLALSACTDPDGTANNTGNSALIGAGLGAIAGQIVGGDTEATVIGAGIGAALGGGVGVLLERQERALQQELAGSGARIVNTGSQLIVSLPEAITFAVDSTVVRDSLRDDLFAIAQNLQQYPNSTVQVIGHTDDTGSASYNQDLSERRAAAVRSILVQGGVSSSRIRAFGMGENQPIATNATAEGRQANRRVEIVITPTR